MRGLVACHEPPAAAVGREIFARGGNVADVAIATAYAQGVANPFDSGLSGKASIHVRLNGAAAILDAGHIIGSRVPPDLWRDKYKGRMYGVGPFIVEDFVNFVGYGSIMTPGFVPATQLLYERFGSGRLSWQELLEPAVRLATDGFLVFPTIAYEWDDDHVSVPPAGWNLRQALAAGNEAARRLLFKPDGRGYRNGELFRQEDHGRTLARIGVEGPEVFYEGAIARIIADDFERSGAFVTYEDMAGYEVLVHEPIEISYRGYRITANPPPGNGMIALLMLNILEGFDLAGLGYHSPEYIATLTDCMRAAFVDRARYRGDPAFVDVPLERLLSKAHAAEWQARVRAGDVPAPTWSEEEESTTHLSVMDGDGNAVSMTHSTGGYAGAAVVTEGLGFLHNSHMKLFDPMPGSVDSIVPGKRQGGSVPIIVSKDGEPILVIGGAGGTRQVTGTVQTIVNVIDHGMEAHKAISASRVHSEHPSWLFYEPGVPTSSVDALRRLGRSVQPAPVDLGKINAVQRDPDTGRLRDGGEVRGDAGRGFVGYFDDESD
jgi:gamma-glutamyltranspeptidase / glutathione hydrolase